MSNRPVVLLCDDDHAVLMTARYCLERHYDLLIAHSGPEALVSLASHDVDVLVTDQRMPDMDGAELCQRAAEISPHTKQIVLTAYSDFQELRRATNSGRVVGCLEKPLRAQVLIDLIDRSMRDPVFITSPRPMLVRESPLPPRRASWFKAQTHAADTDDELRAREAAAESDVHAARDELRAARQSMRSISQMNFAAVGDKRH